MFSPVLRNMCSLKEDEWSKVLDFPLTVVYIFVFFLNLITHAPYKLLVIRQNTC